MDDAPIVCPHCLKDVTNGVGPSDLPLVTKFLSELPSSHIFRIAANWHDYSYHLGYREVDRTMADEFFYRDMLESVSAKCNWFLRPWYRLQAWRNYLFVRKYGRMFFNYDGCVKNDIQKDSGFFS